MELWLTFLDICGGICIEKFVHFAYVETRKRVNGCADGSYSITANERGKIIRTIAAVRPKMKIRTRVSDGEFGSKSV